MKLDEFSLAATTNDLAREQNVREVADVIEFRMDSAVDPISQLSNYEGELPIIATNRSQWFGGKAHDTGRLDRLFTASEFKAVKMVDIEVEIARGTEWILEEPRKNNVDVIISCHEFEDTPDLSTLIKMFEECAQYGDIAKVATFANEPKDSLRLLEAVNIVTEKGINSAGIAMGESGSHTRIAGPHYGSKIGYAPLKEDKSEYAPGQIPIRKLASMIEILTSNKISQDHTPTSEDRFSSSSEPTKLANRN